MRSEPATGQEPDDAKLREHAQLIFKFFGKFHSEAGYVFATCEHAPLVTEGKDEDEALELMEEAIALYLRELAKRGAIEAAIIAGKLHVDVGHAPEQKRAVPRIERRDSGFVANVAELVLA